MDMVIEIAVCLLAALFLMVFHESVKAVAYFFVKGKERGFPIAPWKIWKYMDPIGLILAIVCYVPISRPCYFCVGMKKENVIIGLAGFFGLIVAFCASIGALKYIYSFFPAGGSFYVTSFWQKLGILWLQSCALLSMAMFLANLFPISVFDMGMVLVGMSSKRYIALIQKDGMIKLLFMLALLLDFIHSVSVYAVNMLLR